MGFICRAMFWLAVVGAFLPRELAREPFPPPASAAPEHAPVIDVGVTAAHLCETKPEVCAAGVEAAKAAHAVGDFAVSALRDALSASDADS